VFGSVATDRERAGSDLDLGVVVDEEVWDSSDTVPLIGDCMDAAERPDSDVD